MDEDVGDGGSGEDLLVGGTSGGEERIELIVSLLQSDGGSRHVGDGEADRNSLLGLHGRAAGEEKRKDYASM